MVEADGTSRLGINTGGIDVTTKPEIIVWTRELVDKYIPLFLALGYEKDEDRGFSCTTRGIYVECAEFDTHGWGTSAVCANENGIYIAKESQVIIPLKEADVLMALLLGSNMGET